MGLREYLVAMYASEAAAAFIMVVMWLSDNAVTVLKLGFIAVIAAVISVYFHMAYVYLSTVTQHSTSPKSYASTETSRRE
jgi:hypothetical protein